MQQTDEEQEQEEDIKVSEDTRDDWAGSTASKMEIIQSELTKIKHYFIFYAKLHYYLGQRGIMFSPGGLSMSD